MLQQNVQRVGVAVLASPVEHRGSIIALPRARERASGDPPTGSAAPRRRAAGMAHARMLECCVCSLFRSSFPDVAHESLQILCFGLPYSVYQRLVL